MPLVGGVAHSAARNQHTSVTQLTEQPVLAHPQHLRYHTHAVGSRRINERIIGVCFGLHFLVFRLQRQALGFGVQQHLRHLQTSDLGRIKRWTGGKPTLHVSECFNKLLLELTNHRSVTHIGHEQHCMLTIQYRNGAILGSTSSFKGSDFKSYPSELLKIFFIITHNPQHTGVLNFRSFSNNE